MNNDVLPLMGGMVLLFFGGLVLCTSTGRRMDEGRLAGAIRRSMSQRQNLDV